MPVFNSVKSTHAYIDPTTGEKWPSVSAVKSVCDKPSINGWTVKQTALRAIEAYKSGELGDRLLSDGKERTRKWLHNAARDSMNKSAAKGTVLHELADLHAKGKPWPANLSDDTRARAENFLRFLEDYSPEYLYAEISMVNVDLKYCGTADAIVTPGIDGFPGMPVVLDYKSSASGVFAENGLQLAAYANMTHWVEQKDFGVQLLHSMPEVSKDVGVIVRITPKGYFVHTAKLSPAVGGIDLWSAFRGLRAAYDYYQESQVFGAPAIFGVRPDKPFDVVEALETASTNLELDAAYSRAVELGLWNPADHLSTATQKRAEINK